MVTEEFNIKAHRTIWYHLYIWAAKLNMIRLGVWFADRVWCVITITNYPPKFLTGWDIMDKCDEIEDNGNRRI